MVVRLDRRSNPGFDRSRFARLEVGHHRGQRFRARESVLGGALLHRFRVGCAGEIELEEVCELGVERGGVEPTVAKAMVGRVLTEYAGLTSPALVARRGAETPPYTRIAYFSNITHT